MDGQKNRLRIAGETGGRDTLCQFRYGSMVSIRPPLQCPAGWRMLGSNSDGE